MNHPETMQRTIHKARWWRSMTSGTSISWLQWATSWNTLKRKTLLNFPNVKEATHSGQSGTNSFELIYKHAPILKRDTATDSSPQQLESYVLLAKGHRHTSDTSMPLHIDQFEVILGYMPDCAERIDWFLPTVTEEIYASAKAMCLSQKIQGTLEWGDMVLLFNHTCLARYLHFQISEKLQTGKKLSQSS